MKFLTFFIYLRCKQHKVSMNNIANKIKLNKDLWFTILGNKLVFGNSALSEGFHYTFSFGNRSGNFDLHLTNKKGDHFTVLNISHQNIFEVLPDLLAKISKSVFDLSNFDEVQCISDHSVIYKIELLSDVTSELGILTKKNRVIIDKDSHEFKSFVDKLIEKQSIKIIELNELKKHSQIFGLLQSKTENYFIVKIPFLGDQIFKLNNVDLDINSVLEKILGKDIYDKILDKINEGILLLKD